MTQLFRKKPVIVEALQFEYTTEGIINLAKFCGSNLIKTSKSTGAKGEAEIATLEDGTNLTVKHIATEGDWIIKGVHGEFYPCKPDIFDKTYDCVDPA